MPRTKTKVSIPVQCTYFQFRIFLRNGIYWADGRSNAHNLGRSSLGVTTIEEARLAVAKLDTAMAIKHGLKNAPNIPAEVEKDWSIVGSIARYLEYVSRPFALGGVKPKTYERYRGILKQFEAFASARSLVSWQLVGDEVVADYVRSRSGSINEVTTTRIEIKIIRQALNYLIRFEGLPAKPRAKIRIRKGSDLTRYCYRVDEVKAIVDHCRQTPGLGWMNDIVVGLASTGLRISELLTLRWSDFSPDFKMICLPDESARTDKQLGRTKRTLKNGTTRTLPVPDDLRTTVSKMVRQPDGLVFHGPEGIVLTYDRILREFTTRVIQPLAERFPTPPGEIGFASGRFHSFRHYYCSRCANSGIPERAVMSWLGHKASAIIRHYYHLYDEEAQRQIRTVDFGFTACSM